MRQESQHQCIPDRSRGREKKMGFSIMNTEPPIYKLKTGNFYLGMPIIIMRGVLPPCAAPNLLRLKVKLSMK